MFWNKRKSITDPELGDLEFILDRWQGIPAGGDSSSIAALGGKAGPDPVALAEAKVLFVRQRELAEQAISFVRADQDAIAFAKGEGDLQFEGITASGEPGTFTVELGLSNWPDALLEVKFERFQPKAVLLSD